VVCTRDRAELLEGCLAALAALDYPEYEVLVVDNAGRTADTAQLAERRGARCVREDRPGLDWARNRGIAAARHEVVAFTDDDARPDPGWLRAVGAAFVDPTVMAVTGPVAPVELETRAQEHFELISGGMAHGFVRRRVRRAEMADAQLLWASSFGVGANMAFRRSVFADVRPFDPALDVGTASGGGGDIELLHRLVARGHTLVYEPGALVWHLHRRDFGSLRRLMFDNGRGFASSLYTCGRNRTVARAAIARFFGATWRAGGVLRRVVRPQRDRRHLAMLELLGLVLSPYYYRAARAQARRAAGLARGTRETPPRVFLVDPSAPRSKTPASTPGQS
jgi:glycosyltransferase involved in cell wall biosynthesis